MSESIGAIRSIVTVAVLTVAVVGIFSWEMTENARGYEKDRKLAIHICETTLPRNQHCDAKWSTFIRIPDTILVGLKDGKSTIVPPPKPKSVKGRKP